MFKSIDKVYLTKLSVLYLFSIRFKIYSKSETKMKSFLTILALIFTSLNHQSNAQSVSENIPHLERQGSAIQLIVKGKPFLILGGETGNSSASDLNYMNTIWPSIVKMHLNTLVVPVYWELIEPKGENLILHSLTA